ncbi:MAG TPA: HAMP domain-containing sensor histidine kinase, partial [Nitrolancea sp.]|nr:HAMP domain-containing sensor histidine kinase [Nitrolancea sp.]
MARRITLTVIALVVVILGIVAVPLGLHVASEDRIDFTKQTAAEAATVASVAEEHLDDQAPGVSLAQVIADVQRRGYQVAVYQPSGQPLTGTSAVAGASSAMISSALTGSTSYSSPSPDRLLVVTPVVKDESPTAIGAVALSRSTETLDHRIRALWTWLALASVVGLLAAALTTTALARWVSSPLSGLESAARRLGAGEFAARSPAGAGPREVRRLAGTFNMMAGRLDALVTGHRAMMADVSHQLRTPLAALRLRLDVLALAAPPPLADELAGAQGEVARLSRMVDGLLAVARAENVTSPPVPVPVDAVIKDRVAAWLPAAEEKHAALEARADGPLTARLGEGHLEQILDNLLANALEAVPIGGRIKVSGRQAGSIVRVTIIDDGPGMSVAERRAALRRFVTATPGGTGLGLAIV